MDVGASVRRERLRLGFSLEALAQRSGVSRAMLSEVERGTKNPTIKVLCQVAEGLGCAVSELIQDRLPTAVDIVRRRERESLIDPLSGVERQLLSRALLRHNIEVVWYVIPAGQATEAFPAHRSGVLEHLTVVAGTVLCRIGAQSLQLEAGDSASFPADVLHGFHNPGADACHYVLVIDSSRVNEGFSPG